MIIASTIFGIVGAVIGALASHHWPKYGYQIGVFTGAFFAPAFIPLIKLVASSIGVTP